MVFKSQLTCDQATSTNKSSRVETAEHSEVAEAATAKAEAGLFNEEQWWRWVRDSSLLQTWNTKSVAEKAWELFALVSTQVEEASKLVSLTDKPLQSSSKNDLKNS